ncbi:hypothetical protein A6E02_02240 [Aliivibrio fischeri]|nr:hypothetical protein A6E02_02240 [Aliivibrio fischeri]OED58269.1 hypothetical protein BEI47_01745 [Aliivibrio fischeri]
MGWYQCILISNEVNFIDKFHAFKIYRRIRSFKLYDMNLFLSTALEIKSFLLIQRQQKVKLIELF